jgi:hypothetical protein
VFPAASASDLAGVGLAQQAWCLANNAPLAISAEVGAVLNALVPTARPSLIVELAPHWSTQA